MGLSLSLSLSLCVSDSLPVFLCCAGCTYVADGEEDKVLVASINIAPLLFLPIAVALQLACVFL